jgi:transposase
MSSQNEDEYFKREDAEKLHRIAQEKLKATAGDDAEKLKELHWMCCPKCGFELKTVMWRSVEIERCFHCGVTVLDDGELEKLAGSEDEGTFMRSFFELFRFKSD